MTSPAPELDDLVAWAAELRDARRRCSELVRRKPGLLAALWKTGVPKTGDRGVAATVRQRLQDMGWTEAELEEVGMSAWSIRQALDRAT